MADRSSIAARLICNITHPMKKHLMKLVSAGGRLNTSCWSGVEKSAISLFSKMPVDFEYTPDPYGVFTYCPNHT